MKTQTILLMCAAAIGAIAFHPSAASADVSFNTGRQGTSVCLGSCNSTPYYQAPVVIKQRPVIVEEHTPEWRWREEARLREERRFADDRYRDQRFDSYTPTNYRNYDRRDH